jgi:uncharacterized protein (TIGR01777 family)
MKILVTGATGLVGSSLVPRLRAAGHEVLRLSRGADGPDVVRWDPARGSFDAARCDGCAAVVHLAGESIASGRWTAERMQRIRASRVEGTRVLVEGLAAAGIRPRIYVGASAIGAYGDRGDEVLTEDSEFGEGFLAEVCRDWEGASEAVEAAGARRVLLRIGIVLAREDGALAKMLTPFKLGVGGVVGPGTQWWSWVSLDDLCAIFERALTDEGMSGIYNAVAPDPATNRTFTAALGHALGRPTILPLPAFAARIALGRMADALLLASTRVVPTRLQQAGFRFADSELEPALRRLLAK